MKGESYEKDHRFHTLLGRALLDAEFRARLLQDPEGRASALREVGFAATDEELKAVGQAVDSIGDLAEQFGDIRAAS